MKQEQFAGMRARLMEQLQQGVEWSDEAILERIDQLVSEAARENRLPVSRREEIRRELFYSVRKLDILQELLDDDRVTEDHGKRVSEDLRGAERTEKQMGKIFRVQRKAGRCRAADRRKMQPRDQ